MNTGTVLQMSGALDPRPDLHSDSFLWQQVLKVAQETDPFSDTPKSVYGLLHGLRCGGAVLEVSEQGKLRLDYSALVSEGIWTNRDLRGQWLLPAAGAIKQIFTLAEQELVCAAEQTVVFPAVVGM